MANRKRLTTLMKTMKKASSVLGGSSGYCGGGGGREEDGKAYTPLRRMILDVEALLDSGSNYT